MKISKSIKRKSQKPRQFSMLPVYLISFLVLIGSAACHYYNIEQKLDPENAEFLSKVRYIITKEERKIFLDLPDSEKDKFKEDFWKRRDPDPYTEENEFKMEYLNRIERATELFVSEGKPGWLTDRGRIFILFGPPTDRITYPMGADSYSRCQEIWYYGSFPVVFVDSTCTGDYRLITYDLTQLRSINLMYMHELNMAFAKSQQTIQGETKFFNFDWDVKKISADENRVEGIVTLEMPYANIWFKEKDSKLTTTLDVHLELKDSGGKIVWEHDKSFEVVTSEEDLKESKKKKFHMEIPFVLEQDLDRLRQGKNRIWVTLKNQTGGDELKKVLNFNI